MADTEHYFTTRAAAELLLVDREDVRRAVEAGAIPACDFNRLRMRDVLAIAVARGLMSRGCLMGAARQAGEIVLAHSESDLRSKTDEGRRFLLIVENEVFPVLLTRDEIWKNDSIDLVECNALGLQTFVFDVGRTFENLKSRALRVTRRLIRQRAVAANKAHSLEA